MVLILDGSTMRTHEGKQVIFKRRKNRMPLKDQISDITDFTSELPSYIEP